MLCSVAFWSFISVIYVGGHIAGFVVLWVGCCELLVVCGLNKFNYRQCCGPNVKRPIRPRYRQEFIKRKRDKNEI